MSVVKLFLTTEWGNHMLKSEGLSQSAMDDKNHVVCDSFHTTIEFIGKRWMGIIIYHLLERPKRYHELASEIHGISDRLLTDRLRDLEASGFVVKNVSEATPRKVEYELTQRGKELEGIINAIIAWVGVNGCNVENEK